MAVTVQTVVRLALALVLCGTVGCQTPKEKALTSAQYSASQLRTQLAEAKPQIDRTINSLNHLMRPQSEGEMRTALSVFSADVDEMTRRAQGVRVEADAMERDATTYFRSWDRELIAKGASARSPAAAARGEVADEYKVIQTYMQNLRQRYRNLALNLADIRDQLKASPTTATMQSLSPVANDVRRQALDVQQSIDVLVAEIDKVMK